MSREQKIHIRKYPFNNVVEFKQSLLKEEHRFAKAFTAHLLRFGLERELTPGDTLEIEKIVNKSREEKYRLRSLIREVILSDPFTGQ